MTDRHRGRSRAPIVNRRQTEWVKFTFGGSSISANGSVLLGTGFVATVSGLTIIRLRGELLVTALMNAATDSMRIAMGMILVSDEAFAAGVASIPSPISDIDDDWMYHQFMLVQSGVLSGDGQGTEFRFEVDNKAMRKFPGGKTLVAVMEAESEAGTVVVDVQFNLRGLIKLP